MKSDSEGLIYFDDLEKYVKFRRSKRMSKAHIYMIWRVVKWLEKSKEFRNAGGLTASVYVIRDISVDKNYPDITTELFDVECETGLKHSYDDLKDRILRNPKTVIVVLPNREVKARYEKNCLVRKQRLKFCTLETFPDAVHRAVKSHRARLP
jgi:hypothetical protein